MEAGHGGSYGWVNNRAARPKRSQNVLPASSPARPLGSKRIVPVEHLLTQNPAERIAVAGRGCASVSCFALRRRKQSWWGCGTRFCRGFGEAPDRWRTLQRRTPSKPASGTAVSWEEAVFYFRSPSTTGHADHARRCCAVGRPTLPARDRTNASTPQNKVHVLAQGTIPPHAHTHTRPQRRATGEHRGTRASKRSQHPPHAPGPAAHAWCVAPERPPRGRRRSPGARDLVLPPASLAGASARQGRGWRESAPGPRPRGRCRRLKKKARRQRLRWRRLACPSRRAGASRAELPLAAVVSPPSYHHRHPGLRWRCRHPPQRPRHFCLRPPLPSPSPSQWHPARHPCTAVEKPYAVVRSRESRHRRRQTPGRWTRVVPPPPTGPQARPCRACWSLCTVPGSVERGTDTRLAMSLLCSGCPDPRHPPKRLPSSRTGHYGSFG